MNMVTELTETNLKNYTSIMPQNTVNDLVDIIDQHLAEQTAQHAGARPDSRGTMFVDWDGNGNPIVSYRNQRQAQAQAPQPVTIDGYKVVWYENSRPTPSHAPCPIEKKMSRTHLNPRPAPSPPRVTRKIIHRKPVPGQAPVKTRRKHSSSICSSPRARSRGISKPKIQKVTSVKNRPGHDGLYVKGYDKDTGFSYDYDGRVIHIHKDSRRPSSNYSDYYALDAERYSADDPFVVVDKDLPPLPRERRRREKLVGFIGMIMKKLKDLGILNRLRDNHYETMSLPRAEAHKKPKREVTTNEGCALEGSFRRHQTRSDRRTVIGCSQCGG